MSPADLAAERRRGGFAGVAAILAGALFPAGLFWSQLATTDRPSDNAPAELRYFDRHAAELLGSSALRSIALLLLIVVAVHLYRATKQRNPDLSRLVHVLGVAGPTALAVGGFAHDLYLALAAADYTGRDAQTIKAAEDLITGPVAVATVGLSVAGTLALAFWFVLGSLNAMRAGLLSRFVGVLGIILGPAFVFGLAPLVITFWLLAVGLVFLRRWPRGLPPAWDSGEAIPWPGSSRDETGDALEEPGGALEEPGGSRNGEVEAVGPGVRQGQDTPEVDREAAREGRPGQAPAQARRRKRKRRR